MITCLIWFYVPRCPRKTIKLKHSFTYHGIEIIMLKIVYWGQSKYRSGEMYWNLSETLPKVTAVALINEKLFVKLPSHHKTFAYHLIEFRKNSLVNPLSFVLLNLGRFLFVCLFIFLGFFVCVWFLFLQSQTSLGMIGPIDVKQKRSISVMYWVN